MPFHKVGAGASGSAIAGRLSENGKHSVLLLERGSEAPEIVQVPAISATLGSPNIVRIYKTVPNRNAVLPLSGVR